MLNEEKNLLDKNVLLNIRRNRKIMTANEKRKRYALILSVFLSLLLIAAVYLLSPASRIYRITVEGNRYLTEEDIIEKSGLSLQDRFLLAIPSAVEKRIEQDPLIAECKVSRLDGQLVQIAVREKKIIGYLLEEGQSVLLLETDERIPIGKENLYLISKAPIIEGFTAEDLVLLEKNFAECDDAIINEISEIHNFPALKYQNVELVMRDGNFIFTSPYGLYMLNRYFDIESSYIREDRQCYYFEDISGNAYTSACPWEPKEEKPKENEGEEDPEDYEEDYDEDDDE